MWKQAEKIIYTQMSSMFQPMLNAHICKNGCNNHAFKNMYAKYNSQQHSIIYTSGFRKYKSNIDMTNDYVLLGRFHWLC